MNDKNAQPSKPRASSWSSSPMEERKGRPVGDFKYIDCAKRDLVERRVPYLNTPLITKKVPSVGGTYIIKNKLIYVIQILKDTLNTYPIDTREIRCSKWVNLNEFNIIN